MNAAQEPRRWMLRMDWLKTEVEDGPVANAHHGASERVPVIEASSYDALLAERDALKEKAERLHGALETRCFNEYGECELCGAAQSSPHADDCLAAPDCPAHPDFLTTSATESRDE